MTPITPRYRSGATRTSNDAPQINPHPANGTAAGQGSLLNSRGQRQTLK